MSQEPRKATDLLLDLESKVNTLLDLIRSQDLNNKIISNKLNDIIVRLEKQQTSQPKFTVEAVQNIPLPSPNLPPGFIQMPAGDPERNIPFMAENSLPQETSPKGFRRNSRPETFAKEDFPAYNGDKTLPMQMPKMPQNRPGPGQMVPPPGRSTNPDPEIVAPLSATSNSKMSAPQSLPMIEQQPMPSFIQGQIPVAQRCVDKNGKSIFLAEVFITDLNTNQQVLKTRTHGNGKWMASLGPGIYRVEVSKRESLTKEKLQAIQDIKVDGNVQKLDLPTLIIK